MTVDPKSRALSPAHKRAESATELRLLRAKHRDQAALWWLLALVALLATAYWL